MILVDSHVHLRGCFDPNEFFDRAAANLSRAVAGAPGTRPWTGVLVLTETHGDRPFARLAEQGRAARTSAAEAGEDAWSFRVTREDCSLLAVKGAARLVVIAARQIRTGEGLEVHLLGTATPFPDGRPIADVVAAGEAQSLEVVIPWAPGKWIQKGATVERLVTSRAPRALHLGDIGSRPAWWPTPPPFVAARNHGSNVLRGSDPAPFGSEVRRVGSFGLAIDRELDLDRPTAALRAMLRDPAVRLDPFGGPCSTLTFLQMEVLMAVTKKERTAARSAGA